MSILNVNLGCSYVSNTIRVRIGTSELSVEEVDPTTGRVIIHVPAGIKGNITVDYQRCIFQGGGSKQTRILGESNACIYCGSTQNLSDEHIIPFAIEGDFVIRSASCKSCAEKTSRFERQVLRDALLAPRTALKLRTRRPRERPNSLPLFRKVEGVESIVDVPVAECPAHLVLPLFALPAHLRGDKLPNLKIVAPGARTVLVSATTLDAAAHRVGQGDVGVRYKMAVSNLKCNTGLMNRG